MAIITNKDEGLARQLADRFFSGVFAAVCGQTPEGRPKPDPEIPGRALAVLGLDGPDTLLIGDSVIDLLTAKNCGADFLYADWGYGDRETVGGARAAKNADEVIEIVAGCQIISSGTAE